MDIRTKQANDEMALTKIRIRNIQRDEKNMKPVWAAKQKELYTNSLEIGNPTSLSQIISDEVSNEINNIGNPINRDTALQNLMRITHNPMDATYILEHLSNQAIVYLNFYFEKIVFDIKKYHQKMNKLVFINYLENEVDKNPISILNPQLNLIGQENEANQNMLNAQQSQEAIRQLKENDIVNKEQAREQFKIHKEAVNEHKNVNESNLKRIQKKHFILNPVDEDSENIHNLIPRELESEFSLELERNKGRALLNEKRDKQLLDQRDAPNVKINPIDNTVNKEEAENVEVNATNMGRAMLKFKKSIVKKYENTLNNGLSDYHAETNAKNRAIKVLHEHAKKQKHLKKSEHAVSTKHSKNIEKEAFENIKGKFESNKQEKERQGREQEEKELKDKEQRRDQIENRYRKYLSKMSKPELLEEAEHYDIRISKQKNKSEIIDILVQNELKTNGYGLSYGKGSTLEQKLTSNKIHVGKFYVDVDKLNNKNQLVVKYSKNEGHSHRVKPCIVNSDTKEVLKDILENKFDIRLYNKLAELDQRIIKRFVQTLKLDVPIPADEMDKKFQKEFEILLGEYKSGNDATELKSKLKKYVIEAINENIIPRHQGLLLIYELSI